MDASVPGSLSTVPAAIREAWPQTSFERHLERIDRHGSHLGDLYLAGAAAHRVPAAWTHLETSLCAAFMAKVRGRPLAGLEPEELWSRVRTRQMEPSRRWPELARIGDYLGLVSLLHYLVVAGLRMAISENRRPHPVNESTLSAGSPRGLDVEHPPSPIAAAAATAGLTADELETAAREVEQGFATCLASMDPGDRALLRLIVHAGATQRSAARILGWSEVRVSRRLAALRRSLASAIDAEIVRSDDPRVRGFIAEGVRRWIEEEVRSRTVNISSSCVENQHE